MTTDLGKYLIGLNDGEQGQSGFSGSLLLRDPDYQHGMQIGAAQSTLKAIKSAERSRKKSDAALQSALRGLATLIGAGQNAIIERLDETDNLLNEQILLEKTKMH